MRHTQLFFRTLKEAPHEAETISHQLLERGGYLKKLGKGIYIYTPLMWKVLKKVMNILREELDKAGCQEISMPILHPAELWQRTGRWDDFKSANLLYTLQDREQHDFCLSPTHEEVVTYLVSNWVTSYKQLPLNLYQIGQKFRDEIRPRFGLMRGKEFLMKDGYSFSTTPEMMDEAYLKMRQAYSAFFKRMGLDFVIVEAHGGKIGKGKSEEFQVRASVGEDAVMVCGTYGANIEQTISIPPTYAFEKTLKALEKVPTPNVTSIEELSKFLKVAPQLILKTLVYRLQFPGKEEFVAIGIRGDRQVNEVKVSDYFGAQEIFLATDEEITKTTGSKPGFVGPLSLKIPFYADKTAEPMTNFVCANNIVDVHYLNVNWERDCKRPTFADFLLAEAGDGCPHVPGGTYAMERGIEVGHIFNLGTLYTEKLGALFQDEAGETKPLWMGTYGIGVGRTAAAAIEQKHDDKGIIWPLAIAPYCITILAASTNLPEQVALATELYNELAPYEPLYDDRDERLGLKLKDSDLIGIPFKLIVGKTWVEQKKLEIESREGKKVLISREELREWAQQNLKS